ncbi:MAG: M23 family metallopeptidase, partial [Emcibacteraceae bacterium]|nr:M23 family metallopeptidase [Emcibacteraceae bacterium]
TKYGHLSKLEVKRGDKVDASQLIGLMGSTGRSTSSHLHYEIWFNGKPIDPLKVIKAAKDVQKIKEQRYDA